MADEVLLDFGQTGVGDGPEYCLRGGLCRNVL